ncbi:MAG: HesA/MoeB/ThiF family protein [Armatimonadetes bacterium]|nr:HesA/MoeB/ThiF family protein [Armatimonadota bacterium]
MEKPLPELTDEEREIYRRQIMMSGFGEEGQRKLKEATVLITRVGGLGGPAAMELAMAGIGRMIVIHSGVVELSNLNRQNLMGYDQLGKSRAKAAEASLKKLNPGMELVIYTDEIHDGNSAERLKGVDVAIDSPPTLEERFSLNRGCMKAGVPMVEASMYGMEGQVTTFVPGRTGCLECLYPVRPEWHIPFPVLGAVSGIIGCIAAIEAVKVITGFGQPLKDILLHFDAEDNTMKRIPIRRRPGCPVCSDL